MMIREICRRVLPLCIRKKIRLIMRIVAPKDYQEQRRCFGEKNRDKVFYVIRKETPSDGWGYYRIWLYVLAHIKYAVDKGWIPIVDFENYKVNTLLYEKNYKGNAWEIYSRQPIADITLEEVYSSRRVVLSDKNAEPEELQLESWFWYKNKSVDEINMWKSLVDKFYMLDCNIQKKIDFFYNEKMKYRRVLGVAVRMDYLRGAMIGEARYNGHPVQTPLKLIINDVRHLMVEWNMDAVFLAVDDRETRDYLVKEIGVECIFFERRLLRLFKDGQPLAYSSEREEIFCEYGLDSEGHIVDPVGKNIEYIIEMSLLSKCTCLYAGMSAGVQAACIMNGNEYEHIKIAEYEATVC